MHFNAVITVYLPHLYLHSLPVVNILGSQKYARLLDVPKTWFNNWPDDDTFTVDNKIIYVF